MILLRLTTLAGKVNARPSNASRTLLFGSFQQRQQQPTRAISSRRDEPHPIHRTHSTQPKSEDSREYPRSWQASHNLDIQRVTQTAMIHELTQQQTRSIEKVVPWFLETMPAQYFRQVPESFRLDHIKAISAIKDANMDMHMNLKTHLPDGRQVRRIILRRFGSNLFLSSFRGA
jgi:hypothetical protein